MTSSYTCFDGFRRLASGNLLTVAPAFQLALGHPAPGPVLLFDDLSGRTIDIDTRGTEQELLARLTAADRSAPAMANPSEALLEPNPASAKSTPSEQVAGAPRGRGRPRLGVVAREVTLLPRHWDWLAAQSGGASVVLRKLVEQARRADKDTARLRHERAYHFMSAIAGDLPGFEEAIRALFANDLFRFEEQIAAWPDDMRVHALWLATGQDNNRDGTGATRHCESAGAETRTAA